LLDTRLHITNGLLESASVWILESGILEPNGGVARYYRSDTRQNARVSTEITGYTLSALRFLHQRGVNQKVLDALNRAALFLTGTAWDRERAIFPFEWEDKDAAPRSAYFFDCGIITRGLLAAWRTSPNQDYLDVAVACGRAMAIDFRGNELFHPILSLPDKSPRPQEPRWSARPGCYQLKAALAWLQLHELTGEEIFRDAWEESLDWSLASHETFLPGDPDHLRVMDRLHAYCYFLEGLLPVLDRQPCVKAFSEGLDRVSHFLRQISPHFVRSDVYAQLLRARVYAAAAHAIPLDPVAAGQEANAASTFQIESADPRVHGAFSFGSKDGSLMPFANPVSTMFCMEALTLWAGCQTPGFQTDWRDLI